MTVTLIFANKRKFQIFEQTGGVLRGVGHFGGVGHQMAQKRKRCDLPAEAAELPEQKKPKQQGVLSDLPAEALFRRLSAAEAERRLDQQRRHQQRAAVIKKAGMTHRTFRAQQKAGKAEKAAQKAQQKAQQKAEKAEKAAQKAQQKAQQKAEKAA